MCSLKKVFRLILQNSQQNTYTKVGFNKVSRLQCSNLFKKRVQAGVFLWILGNISVQNFYRTTVGCCFWTVIAPSLLLLLPSSYMPHNNYMELFYATIHVMHLIKWLKLEKTLRKTKYSCELWSYQR